MLQRICNRCKKIINSDYNYFKLTSAHEIPCGLASTDRYDLCVDCHIVFTSQFLEGK